MYIEIACDFLDRTQQHKLVKFDALYIRMFVSVNKNSYLFGWIYCEEEGVWRLYVEIACNFLDRTQHLKLVEFDALYIRMFITVKLCK